MTWIRNLLCVLLAFIVPAHTLRAQGGPHRAMSPEESTVEAARAVLHEIMEIPAKAIPEALLSEAYGVAIIPGMVKGGFIIGVRHGNGVVLTRNAAGVWTAPTFITVTGGSIGWQAGVQSTDVIIVFRNRRGVEGMMRGKFTIGADASVAAGPIGRQASAATDAQLKAEILSYSRSRGLFVGVSIDGAAIQVDHRSNEDFYALKPGQPAGTVPASAIKLVELVAHYAGGKHKVAVDVKDLPAAPPLASQVEMLRGHLADSALRLHKLLDPQWKQFLALPAEIYAEHRTPTRTSLDHSLASYRSVANDQRFQALSSRPEFQDTYALLVRYRNALERDAESALKLPPPPPR